MSKKEQYRITRCRSLLAGFKLARLPSKVMDDIQGACVRSLGCGSASQPAGSAAGQPRLPGDSADGRTDGRAGRERFHALGGSHKQPITGRFLGERRLPDAPSNGEPLAACQPGVKKSCSFPPHTPRFSSPLFQPIVRVCFRARACWRGRGLSTEPPPRGCGQRELYPSPQMSD